MIVLSEMLDLMSKGSLKVLEIAHSQSLLSSVGGEMLKMC